MIGQAIMFWTLAVLTVASAMGVAVSRSIVRMAVWLLFALMGVAGLFLLLDAEFLAAVQLVVYAGGILVLIVFGIMLTGSDHRDDRRSAVEMIVAILAAAVMAGGLMMALWPGHAGFADRPAGIRGYGIVPVGLAFLGEYLVPFELLSVLLLVAMIGAAYLGRPRRRGPARTSGPFLP